MIFFHQQYVKTCVILVQRERRGNEMTSLLLLLEEIIHNHQINMLLVSLMITLIGSQTHKFKCVDRINQSHIINSIHTHVRHLDRLVRLTDRSCMDNLRMDRNTFSRLCRILHDSVGLIYLTMEGSRDI